MLCSQNDVLMNAGFQVLFCVMWSMPTYNIDWLILSAHRMCLCSKAYGNSLARKKPQMFILWENVPPQGSLKESPTHSRPLQGGVHLSGVWQELQHQAGLQTPPRPPRCQQWRPHLPSVPAAVPQHWGSSRSPQNTCWQVLWWDQREKAPLWALRAAVLHP